jgi:LysR family transcriptional regulator for metE and metH
MRLDIKHWQLLKALAELGTLGKAADQLGITQSALSHRLAEAERRLGDRLFEREGRNLSVTPAGQSMLQTAQQILPELQRAEDDFQRLAKSAQHLLRVGIAAYSAYHWVPDFLNSLPFKRERLQLDLVASATQHPVRSLLSGDADLVIAPGQISNPGVESKPLFSDELVLVTAPDHPLAQRSHIEAEDLATENYLTYSRDSQPGFEYERFIRPSGISPQYVQVVEWTDAIVELVVAGFGVSILSRWALQRSIGQGIISVTALGSNGLPLQWSILNRVSDRKREPVRLLKQQLLSWFNSHQDERGQA